MPDGRVPLLFCIACYDLDCQTLTTEVSFDSGVIAWRDIGWQVGYEPFDADNQERKPITVAFKRDQYESVITNLVRSLEAAS